MEAGAVLVVALAAVAATVALVLAFALGTRTATTAGTRAARMNETELLQEALDRLRAPVLVVTGSGRVLHSSEEARRLGLVRGGFLAHRDLRDVAEQRLRAAAPAVEGGDGVTLVLPRGPVGEGQLEVRVFARRLRAGQLLLDVENRSEAMRVEDVRRDFVVNVSHELKTPVGAISILAETLEDAADDPATVRQFVARIRQECSRLQVLVTDVLELSRVQVVDGTSHHEPVPVDAVVAEALDEVRSRAEEHRILLSPPPVVGATVLGDRDLLTTAVRNLLVNAITYSPPGTRVSVSVGRRQGLVLVQVTDRGVGIPVAEQARVFERFYRVDPARSRRTGGTGLGLAIVKHVVEGHGGDVLVWSRPEQGSTFTIRLPEAETGPGAPQHDPRPTDRGVPR